MTTYFELKAAARSQYVWNLKAGNHEVILTSEVFKDKDVALNCIAAVKKNASEEKRFLRRVAKDGQFFFELINELGKTLGRSERYKAEAGRDKDIS